MPCGASTQTAGRVPPAVTRCLKIRATPRRTHPPALNKPEMPGGWGRRSVAPTCHLGLNIPNCLRVEEVTRSKREGCHGRTPPRPPLVGWLPARLPPAWGAAPPRDPVTALLPRRGAAAEHETDRRWREDLSTGLGSHWRFGAAWRKGEARRCLYRPRPGINSGQWSRPPSHVDKHDAMGGQS